MDKYKMLEKMRNNLNNTSFDYFVKVVTKFGFEKLKRKTSGSHNHKYRNAIINEKLNLHSKKGKAKSYQIKQFLNMVEEYNL